MTSSELPPERLHHGCDPEDFPFSTTEELEEIPLDLGQERARRALHFGIEVEREGFNVFALGPDGIGKHSTVQALLEERARMRPPPPDWVYVYDFDQPRRPRALKLPAGQGARFHKDMDQLIEDLRSALPAAFESEHYKRRTEELEEELKRRQAQAIKALGEEARMHGLMLIETPTGFVFAPMGENEEVLSPEEFNKLPEERQKAIEAAAGELNDRLREVLRQMPLWRKEMLEKVRQLNREIAEVAVNHLILELRQRYLEVPGLPEHLDRIRQDVIDNVPQFIQGETAPSLPLPLAPPDPYSRYRVNLLVSNEELEGAPVVYEDLPNHANLIGRSEYQAQMGTLVTDFTLIRPGALHRANGGYLLLDARKLLLQPYAWDLLKRTLKAGEIRIEPLEKTLSLISTVSLEPEPIPLDLKLVLLGDRLLYYLLCELDPEFADLFKVAADFEERIDRTPEQSRLYARLIGTLARRDGLRPLDREAVMRTIEHSARLAGDGKKLSTELRAIGDLLVEADHWAGAEDVSAIGARHVQRAITERERRLDRLRQQSLEQIERGVVIIDTAGERRGCINGLSVLELGGYAFGRPSRITATCRLGDGEVLDIERETELGGPIHSKGVFILSGFLSARYAASVPLSMSASLVFEQSYGGVEGDSASLAELCALISELSGCPIRQCLAVTGSVNQQGEVQPIGGVNEKIEGFFEVCRRRGLDGSHGVIIPTRNVDHLMLRREVVDAVAAGKFHIHAVDTVDQALELLTGQPAGAADEEGNFPPDTVNGRAQQRLLDFALIRQSFSAGKLLAAGQKEEQKGGNGDGTDGD
ncbi:MAG: ATP-dependent protease [Gammaproteobacteria bacterium]|nr:MAG: ATP-dependent protease [Gammaproteobacteria bacterium]